MNYNKIKLGEVDGVSIYLSPPSWDCGWYWGFGYLGNKNCHYHVSGLFKDTNLYEGFKNHFGSSFIVKNDKDLWTLCELFRTFYYLKDAAELFRVGGSRYTMNPIVDLIKNENEVKRINEDLMPLIFEEIYKILNKK